MPRVQILFVYVNLFVITLDTWYIIKIWNEINTFLKTKLESNTQTQKRERERERRGGLGGGGVSTIRHWTTRVAYNFLEILMLLA